MGNSSSSASTPAHGGPTDPTDPEYWRSKGDAHHAARATASAASQEAYKRGDHATAKAKSEEAKRHLAAAKDAHARAAEMYLAKNNAGRGGDELDLHGLRVKEALAQVERALKEGRESGRDKLVIIVGKGLHSEDGIAKIKPAVLSLVRKHSVLVTPGVPNAGCITVEFVKPEEAGVFGWFKKACGCAIM